MCPDSLKALLLHIQALLHTQVVLQLLTTSEVKGWTRML